MTLVATVDARRVDERRRRRCTVMVSASAAGFSVKSIVRRLIDHQHDVRERCLRGESAQLGGHGVRAGRQRRHAVLARRGLGHGGAGEARLLRCAP